jgi:exopolysaccharide biosynthesis polyprenyl glycosylphosphotransferase
MKMAAQAPQSPRESFGSTAMSAMALPAREEKRRDIPLSFADFSTGRDFYSPALPAWVAADAVLALGATAVAVSLALRPGASFLLPVLTSYVSLLLLALKTCGLYEGESEVSPLREGLNVCKAVAVASMIFLIVQISAQPEAIRPKFVLAAAMANAAALTSWRMGFRALTRRRAAQGKSVRHALIVGGGQLGRSLGASIEHNRDLGIAVKGYVDDRHCEGEEVLGTLADCLTVARAEFIDEIYITLPILRPGIMDLINRARERHISVKVVPALLEGYGAVPFQFIGTHPAFTLHEEPVRGFAKFLKRLVDIAGASILLVFTGALMLVIAIVVKLDSKGPVLYCADRVGFKGRKFKFYKFRSMVKNADEMKEKLRHLNERNGPFFKITDDPRLTRTGRFLRATSLDELPQIFNVLRGDMSLVGPRPHPVDDYRQYRLEHRRRLDVLPGITGLWQVTARSDPSFERTMQLDLHYIDHWSFWLDLKILAKTLPAVLRKEGV